MPRPLHPSRRALLGGLTAVAGSVAGGGVLRAQNRGLALDAALGGEPVSLRSERRFAGAISSLRYRGVEYVDANDHGRLFQGAVQFGGLGECFNPTLAGASRDRSRSTSRLLDAEVGGDLWATTTQMAYWNRPGDVCTTPRGLRRRPANRVRLSDVLYTQRHRFGALAAANAVEAEIAVSLASPAERVVIEALTIYTPALFDTVHRLNDGGLALDEVVATSPGERPEPRILSTADGTHAVSLISLQGPAGHGRWRFATSSKLNLVFRPSGSLPPGHHRFRCAWAIGTREEVAAALRTLTPGRR